MNVVQKKICMLGSFAVGKTSLVRRFIEGRFDDKYLSTIGVKISRKPLTLDTTNLNLIIWDLAGGDEWLRSNQGYLRGLSGALLVGDLTRPFTLTSLLRYREQVRDMNPQAPLVLAANKVDLERERQVTDAEIEDLARTLACPYWLTSAKRGDEVEQIFEALARQIMAQHEAE